VSLPPRCAGGSLSQCFCASLSVSVFVSVSLSVAVSVSRIDNLQSASSRN